jgi:hypothetical protein
MITWDPPWPCWSDSYLLPMLPITMSCGHSFTSMDSPTMMSELSNILWKPPWFDKAVLLELCSTLWKPSSLRPPPGPPTRALSLNTSLPCLGRLDSILLSDLSTRLYSMQSLDTVRLLLSTPEPAHATSLTQWRPPWLFMNTRPLPHFAIMCTMAWFRVLHLTLHQSILTGAMGPPTTHCLSTIMRQVELVWKPPWILYTSIAMLPPGELDIVLVRISPMQFHPQAAAAPDLDPSLSSFLCLQMVVENKEPPWPSGCMSLDTSLPCMDCTLDSVAVCGVVEYADEAAAADIAEDIPNEESEVCCRPTSGLFMMTEWWLLGELPPGTISMMGAPLFYVPPPVADGQGGVPILLPGHAQHGDYNQPHQQLHYLQHKDVQLSHPPVDFLHNPDHVEKANLVKLGPGPVPHLLI